MSPSNKFPKKKGKQAASVPETADEYLEAGVNLEETGEKWRGGDALKATRFFLKAIACYEEGLDKFPKSFDLAYNKARLQYDITQQPKISPHILRTPVYLLYLLDEARISFEVALKLEETVPDALFNYAQVLVSFVEAFVSFPLPVTDAKGQSPACPRLPIQENLPLKRGVLASSSEELRNRPLEFDCLDLLNRAMESFSQCYKLQIAQKRQEKQMKQNLQGESSTTMDEDEDEGGVSLVNNQTSSRQDYRWATIVESVTDDIIIDTLLAELQCLTTMCSLVLVASPSVGEVLNVIAGYSDEILDNNVLPRYVTRSREPDRTFETILTRANFRAAFADVNFRHQRIDAQKYFNEICEAFQDINSKNGYDHEALVNKAEALIAYNAATADYNTHNLYHASRWAALSAALSCLAPAITLPNLDRMDIAKLHLLRGDVEILRYQLGQQGFKAAADNSTTLLNNAAKYYRGARRTATDVAQTLGFEALAKESLALALTGDNAQILELEKSNDLSPFLNECINDGIITAQQIQQAKLILKLTGV